ncbi:site-specific integrase [Myxococcus xanthus]|uniref:tyrosine-type recombinase/integrase n=1 Tax=Myxococcus xanthus TaxID=34 RepID=UPI0019177593|nr:site-specific integrase [Myxococcus xanthus]QQR46513.1 site-specific integrase [Myxococcus xanthus]
MMGTVYLRSDSKFYWIGWTGLDGKQKCKSSRTMHKASAEKLLAAIERKVEAERESGLAAPELGPITVGRYAQRWLKERGARGIASINDDTVRLNHAMPYLQDLVLADVRPRHVLAAVRALQAKKTDSGGPYFAPRSILHIYAVLRGMFTDAVREELISASPCVLTTRRGELPKPRDKNLAWRHTAIFAREEVVQLITTQHIPEPRRVLYALLFLGGMRINEATPRRFSHYQPHLHPLGKLLIASSYDRKRKLEKAATKTGVVREVPVHPVLARLLRDWQAEGWARCYGRQPTPEDFIVPALDFRILNSNVAYKGLLKDLEQLGLRPRRQHDARRTFITCALEDGARKELLRWVTHGPGGDIVDSYTSPSWQVRCEQVALLKLPFPEVLRSTGNTSGEGELLRNYYSQGNHMGLQAILASGAVTPPASQGTDVSVPPALGA